MQALSTAAAGMMAAADRLNASAQRVAASDANYVKERTDQISAADDFKANATVIRTADQMTATLLDMKV